ncbi:SMP-30/gluconolactonase/LRE family protein [Arthrobacter mangrovi]|uniref:SMP-30/gluconolactonase/LRE family protein n=1 Tax=Arthrobacter mangrovi TaxID=2966350 RepID=UPI002231C339|nr:SMP-30/gluconolactonase/LRE family protein [Arthrobacter mangrovi]
MHPQPAPRSALRPPLGRTAAGLLGAAALLVSAGSAPAFSTSDDDRSEVIKLPGASSAEGIAADDDGAFYAGDLFKGDIFLGDLDEGTAEQFIDAPAGRMALGMDLDTRSGTLAVAGGAAGDAYFYDVDDGDTTATVALTKDANAFINDVIFTGGGAWFTNSVKGELYFVPVDSDGDVGEVETLALSGPAAKITGDFNLNGIAATDDDDTLIVAHTANKAVYTVDTDDGESQVIAGVKVPYVDGIELDGRNLWTVQNFDNKITRWRLDSDLESGKLRDTITDKAFQVPTTAALVGDQLLAVNAKFDTGIPPKAKEFEVVVVDAYGND